MHPIRPPLINDGYLFRMNSLELSSAHRISPSASVRPASVRLDSMSFRVRLRSGAFDTLRYGYVEARVEEVALEPQAAGRYLVKVRVEKTPVPLTLGSTVEGDIILRRSPIWRLLFPARDEL